MWDIPVYKVDRPSNGQRQPEGFTVDLKSIKTDCEACTEAKQTTEPFRKTSEKRTNLENSRI
jgi:hypothetical protein